MQLGGVEITHSQDDDAKSQVFTYDDNEIPFTESQSNRLSFR